LARFPLANVPVAQSRRAFCAYAPSHHTRPQHQAAIVRQSSLLRGCLWSFFASLLTSMPASRITGVLLARPVEGVGAWKRPYTNATAALKVLLQMGEATVREISEDDQCAGRIAGLYEPCSVCLQVWSIRGWAAPESGTSIHTLARVARDTDVDT